jgi:hypothetical protein
MVSQREGKGTLRPQLITLGSWLDVVEQPFFQSCSAAQVNPRVIMIFRLHEFFRLHLRGLEFFSVSLQTVPWHDDSELSALSQV